MRPRTALLVPPTRIYREIAAACSQEFAAMGVPHTVHHRVRSSLLRADVLWIAGLAPALSGLGRLLSRRRPGDARVVLWQLEPLPPPLLSDEGWEAGRRAARWQYPNVVRPLRMLIEPLRPLLRRYVGARQEAAAGAYLARVRADRRVDGWGHCTTPHLVATMREAVWLDRAARGRWIDHCFASTRPRVRFLRRLGLRARLLPVGGHPVWGSPPEPGSMRDIDVLLLAGLADPRRVEALRAVGATLAAAGRRLVTIDRGLYGEERTRVLRRTRVVLNIPRFQYDFAGMRMPMAMGCGAAVLSEPCPDTWPYRAGRHFEAASFDDLGAAALRLLDDEERRRGLAEEGRGFVTGPLALRRLLGRSLRLVEGEVRS